MISFFFVFCLDAVPPALVTEGAEGRGCWDVDPGTQGVGTDLAVSDAGEKVLWTAFSKLRRSFVQ